MDHVLVKILFEFVCHFCYLFFLKKMDDQMDHIGCVYDGDDLAKRIDLEIDLITMVWNMRV
jgi:hypothetical protein